LPLPVSFSGCWQIAIIGDAGKVDTRVLLSAVRSGYRLFQVIALGELGAQPSAVPTLRDPAQWVGNPQAMSDAISPVRHLQHTRKH
jgi:hypothetical protein